MRVAIAKALELVGLGIVGLALLVGLSSEHALKQEMTLFLLGVFVFVAGWLIERGAGAAE